MGLGGGDADPNPEMNVWLSSGGTHLWQSGTDQAGHGLGSEDRPVDAEANDGTELRPAQASLRSGSGDNCRQPTLLFLATPNILVGARNSLANFKPAVLEPTALWNIEEVYFR